MSFMDRVKKAAAPAVNAGAKAMLKVGLRVLSARLGSSASRRMASLWRRRLQSIGKLPFDDTTGFFFITSLEKEWDDGLYCCVAGQKQGPNMVIHSPIAFRTMIFSESNR